MLRTPGSSVRLKYQWKYPFLPPFICRESEACCLAEKEGSGFHKSISRGEDSVFV